MFEIIVTSIQDSLLQRYTLNHIQYDIAGRKYTLNTDFGYGLIVYAISIKIINGGRFDA